MAKRYFNWPLAIVLVVTAAVLAVSAVLLRGWQRKLRADRALPLAEEAYGRADWEEAARQFGRYVTYYSNDTEKLLKYAEAQQRRRPQSRDNLAQAREVYASILRDKEASAAYAREAAIALVELDLEVLRAFGEAESNATQYLKNNDDPTVRRLLAMALRGRGRWAEAATELTNLIEAHPEEVLAYEVMGELAKEHPADVNGPAADHWFDEAVRQNPDSALAYVIRASFHLRTGDPNAALVDLKQARRLDLSDAQVRLRLVEALVNARLMDEARQELKVLQTEAPDELGLYRAWAVIAMMSDSADEMQTVAQAGLDALGEPRWDFLPAAAELFIRAGRDDKARECIAQMRAKGLRLGTVAYLEGRIAERNGRLDEAVTYWRRAIALNCDDYLSYFYLIPSPVRWVLASALERLGDPRSAIEHMRALVSDTSGSDNSRVQELHLQSRLYLAHLLAQTGDWSAVLDETSRIAQIDPNSPDGRLLRLQARLAQLQIDKEKPGTSVWLALEKDVTDFDDASGSLSSGLLRARVAAGQGNYAQAHAVLDRLDRTNPGQSGIARLRARLYVAQAQQYADQGLAQQAAEKEQDATSVLRRAIEAFPQSVELVADLVQWLEQQEKVQECESVIAEAMARIDTPQARRDLGLWLASQERERVGQDKLYELLADVAQQQPTDVRVKRALLSFEAVAKDPAAVQKLVDEIKAIEGEDGGQWRLEQARTWAGPETFNARYAEIVGLLQENLRANPADNESRWLLAMVYERAGETELALAMYREVLDREPDNIAVILRVVDALERAGRGDEVKKIIEDARRRDLYHPDLRRIELNERLRFSTTTQDAEQRREALASASRTLEEMLAEDPNDIDARLAFALVLARQKRFDEAQAVIDEVKATNPQALDVTVAQLRLYVEQGNAERALRLCDAVVEDSNSAAGYVMRAWANTVFDRRDAALEDFSRAVELEPNAPAWRLMRADLYRQRRQRSEALADARHALALAPDSLNAQRLAVALLLESARGPDLLEAEQLLARALEANPQDPQLRVLRARLLGTQGTAAANEQARTELNAVTRSHPHLVEAWELLVRLELSEDPDTAILVANRGLASNPDSKSLRLLWARAQLEVSPSVAIPMLDGMATRDPNDFTVVSLLATAYVRSGNPEAAREMVQGSRVKTLLDKLVQDRPDDPRPVLALAELFSVAHDFAGLRQLVADWHSRNPADARIALAAAELLSLIEAEAAHRAEEEFLRELLQRDPTSIRAMHLLAILTLTTGRGEESAQLNRRILDLDPNDVVAMNNLAWFLCEEQQRHPEALDLASRGLTLAPNYSDLLDTRGVIYYRMGRHEEAIRDFAACIAQYSRDTRALTGTRFHLGRAYAALGRRQQAQDELTRSLYLNDRIGGLSPSDLAEAKRLLAQMQEGI